MNKTFLSAFCALASVTCAFAETEPAYTLTATTSAPIQTGIAYEAGTALSTKDGTRHSFTMTIVLDWDSLSSKDYWTTSSQYVIISNCAGSEPRIGIGIKQNDDGKLIATAMYGSGTEYSNLSTGVLSDYVFDGHVVLTLTANASGGALYQLTETGKNATVSVDTDSGFLFTYNNDAPQSRLWFSSHEENESYSFVENVVIYNTDMGSYGSDKTAIAAISTAALSTVAVPEPATATLSLLALAGLAVRRRRQ